MTTVSNDGKPKDKTIWDDRAESEDGDYVIAPVGMHPRSEKKLIEIYTGWKTRRDSTRTGYIAQSPNFAKDGLEIFGKGSKQVIERILALLNLEIPQPAIRKFDSGETVVSADLIRKAREDGYTGDVCNHCGSMHVKRYETCHFCEECKNEMWCV